MDSFRGILPAGSFLRHRIVTMSTGCIPLFQIRPLQSARLHKLPSRWRGAMVLLALTLLGLAAATPSPCHKGKGTQCSNRKLQLKAGDPG